MWTSKNLKSEIRRWVEVAMQDTGEVDAAVEFAAGRLYDGIDGVDQEAHKEFCGMNPNEAYQLVVDIVSEY
jgi:hypothetical protein